MPKRSQPELSIVFAHRRSYDAAGDLHGCCRSRQQSPTLWCRRPRSACDNVSICGAFRLLRVDEQSQDELGPRAAHEVNGRRHAAMRMLLTPKTMRRSCRGLAGRPHRRNREATASICAHLPTAHRQRLLTLVVSGRTHAKFHQAVVGACDRRSREWPPSEILQTFLETLVAVRPTHRRTRGEFRHSPVQRLLLRDSTGHCRPRPCGNS